MAVTTIASLLNDDTDATSKKQAVRLAVGSGAVTYTVLQLDRDRKYYIKHLSFNATGVVTADRVKIDLNGAEPDISVFGAEVDTIWLAVGDVFNPPRGRGGNIALKGETGGNVVMLEVAIEERVTGPGSMEG